MRVHVHVHLRVSVAVAHAVLPNTCAPVEGYAGGRLGSLPLNATVHSLDAGSLISRTLKLLESAFFLSSYSSFTLRASFDDGPRLTVRCSG